MVAYSDLGRPTTDDAPRADRPRTKAVVIAANRAACAPLARYAPHVRQRFGTVGGYGGKVSGGQAGKILERSLGASAAQCSAVQRSAVHGRVNGRLTAAPEGATWSLNGCAAAGRSAAEVGARALPDAPPSRRGWMRDLIAVVSFARGRRSVGG